MEVKIITRHSPVNYGSLLQSIATIKVLEILGYDCKIIDYQRSDEKGIKAVLNSLKSKKNWNRNILKSILYILVRYPTEKMGEVRFSWMRKKYLSMTRLYDSYDSLKNIQSDIFMTGSDQVWGNISRYEFDEAYFLTFAPKESKKISYAASFGKTEFSDETAKRIKRMLSDYQHITVRENKAEILLNKWGVKNEGQVVDPTLLLDFKDWNSYIKKDIANNYVLVYEIHNNPNLDKYALDFSKHVKLPLVRISAVLHQFNRGGRFVYCPDIGVFLSYIKNCKYLITDSFHGTAFGLNFNKQIIEVMPNNSTGSRNLSLLQLTGLTDRIITDFSDFSISQKNIDYNRVNEILKRERDKSFAKLNRMLRS